MSGAAILTGKVMHRRLRPKVHQLDYRLFALLLDVDRIDETAARLRFFSAGRFNLLSFRAADHGDGSNVPLRAQADAMCARAGIARPQRVELFAMPRLLGFAFNPLSLWLCHGAEEQLNAIIYEVHNTFGERHFYVAAASGGAIERHSAAKAFHVSPFLPMDLDYRFRLRTPGERMLLGIEVRDSAGPVLVAVQRMERRALSDGAILRAAAAMPLMTVKVVAGILWEAARLWLKGIVVHRHPGQRPATMTLAQGQSETVRAEAA